MDLASRITAMAPGAKPHRPFLSDHPGDTRRVDRKVSASDFYLDDSCMPGSDFLLHDHRSRILYIADMEARLASGSRHASGHCTHNPVCTDYRLCLSSAVTGCVDATHAVGPCDSGLPASLR